MKINHTLLNQVLNYSQDYLSSLEDRPVMPPEESLTRLEELDFPLPNDPVEDGKVLALLGDVGNETAVATAGGRYFGFVNGATLPIAHAANILTSTWDQNAALKIMSPLAAKTEEVAQRWLLDLLKLPSDAGVGFVTGATMANFTALAAARHALLRRQGWNVEAQGLFGAPEITIVAGEEIHVSMLKALSMVGFGSERIIKVPADDQGRIIPDMIPKLDEMTILCLQAGNVNSGAIDPLKETCEIAHRNGAWVHVDGAFGLWAAASQKYSHLIEGVDMPDSWAVDLHKWLNLTYDSGVAIVKDANHLRSAMSANADYLPIISDREPCHFTPEMSRRARGIEAWAALYALGRSGVEALVDRCCAHAGLFAELLSQAGFEILNEVCINQVVVSFGDDEFNDKVIAAIQEDRTTWAGGTKWKGRRALRLSVSSWATTKLDIKRAAHAIIRIVESIK